jgi:hypothetical protein
MAGKIYGRFDSKVIHPALGIGTLTETLHDLLYGFLRPLRTGLSPLRRCHFIKDVHRRKSRGWYGRVRHRERRFNNSREVYTDGKERGYAKFFYRF